jgi:hypothetical protein
MMTTNSNDSVFLKKMNDPELLSAAHARVSAEKKATLSVLYCLREIEQRRLHLARGFQSMFDFVTRELGYSPAAAQRRILAMRLLREIPELEIKIEQGLMTLDTAARVQGFFNQEQKSVGKFSVEKKKKVLSELEGKSSRQCERILASRSSQPEAFLRPDSVKPVGASSVEVRFVAAESLVKELGRLRELLSHKNPSLSMAELIAELAKIALAELDPARRNKAGSKTDKSKNSEAPVELSLQPSITPTQEALPGRQANLDKARQRLPETSIHPAPKLKPRLKVEQGARTRYIPIRIRSEVFERDGYRCAFVDPLTGRRCDSRFQLELDHWRVPFAKGGMNSASNLQILCKNHNLLRAVQVYGASKMSSWSGRKPPGASCYKNPRLSFRRIGSQ